MVCKRVFKENKYPFYQDYEKIQDLNAYQVMFQVTKASKFGGKLNRQMSSKLQKLNFEKFDREDYLNEDVDLFDGRSGRLSF